MKYKIVCISLLFLINNLKSNFYEIESEDSSDKKVTTKSLIEKNTIKSK